MLEKLPLFLLGCVVTTILGVCVYFLKRKVENIPETEGLDKSKKLLDINRELNQQGLKPEDLSELEAVLTGKAASRQKHNLEVAQETTVLLDTKNKDSLTQNELNALAHEKYEIAEEKLQSVLRESRSKLGEPELSALDKAQESWEDFSVEQAEAASITYRDGTIYPVIFLAELESTTIDRTAQLKSELDELKRLGN